MRNELEGFENRENDWLAKEIRREAKLSPWNVDEAKIIKEEHARVHERQNTINQASTDNAQSSTELNQVYNDIKTFLDQNPDLNKKLHDLNLDSAYYGQLEKQNIANNTNTQANVTQ